MPKHDKDDHIFDKIVFCPFYRATEHQQVIRCEGPVDGTSLRLSFSGKKRCREYVEQYCAKKACEQCTIYKIAQAKYND